MRLTIAVLVVVLCGTALADPVTLSDRTVVHTTFDEGCAAAWRISASGSLLWYFALKSPRALTVSEREGAVILANDGVVARDDLTTTVPANRQKGRRSILQVHRPAGPCVSKDPKWLAQFEELRVVPESDALHRKGDWFYVVAGTSEAPRLVVRMTHVDALRGETPRIAREGNVVVASSPSELFDDGTFVSASINPEWLYEEISARERIRKSFGEKREAPELSIARWVQSAAPLTLAALKEQKVVLLDFWGVWCQPCVAAIPELAELRKAIPSETFAFLGIHSVQSADQLEAFLKKQVYPAPVGVDTGETAKTYAVSNWPTYVLIDKHGRVVSYGSRLPSRAKIEELLLLP